MADLFGRQDQLLNGGLSSDSMFVTWPSLAAVTGSTVGLLIQQIGIEYRQPVRRIFEIGPGVIPFGPIGNIDASFCDSPGRNVDPCADICAFRAQPTYYIVGRPEGRMQMGRFVGPNALTVCFYRKYGSPCGPNNMLLSGRAGCDAAGTAKAPKMTWIMNGVLLDNVAMDINGQEMVIQERIGAMFVGLNIKVDDKEPTCLPAGTPPCNQQTSTTLPGSGGTGQMPAA